MRPLVPVLESRPQSGSHLIVTVTLASIAVAAFTLVVLGLPDGSVRQRVLDDGGMIALLGVASILAFSAARRQPAGRARWSWLLIGLGLLCWMIGDIYWGWAELVLDVQPDVPSPADIAYVGQVILTLSGILIRPLAPPRDISRRILALDVAIASSALVAVTWTLALGPLFARLGTAPLEQILGVSYPLADLAVVCFLVVMLIRSAENRLAVKLLTAGWAAIALADATYTVLAAENAYQTGHWVDLAWFVGVTLVALAALEDAPRTPSLPSGPAIGRARQFITPAILVVAAGLVAWIYPIVAEGDVPSTEHMALALALILLTVRIALGYRDAVLVHRLFIAQSRDRETARAALEEAARLQGVLLAGRELAHLLNNDLAIAVGSIELLREQSTLPPGLHQMVDDASMGLERAAEHLRRLQHVSRVTTRQTPLGPSLDLDRSTGE